MDKIAYILLLILTFFSNNLFLLLNMPIFFGKNLFLVLIYFVLLYKIIKIDRIDFFHFLLLFFLSAIIIFIKFFFLDDQISFSNIFKFLSPFVISILSYNFFLYIQLSNSIKLNILLIILIVLYLIALLNYFLFPGIIVDYNIYGDPLAYSLNLDINNYSRDGLFGANIMSYISSLIIIFLNFSKSKIKVNRFILIFFYLTCIPNLFIWQSRYVFVFLGVLFIIKYFRYILYFVPLVLIFLIFQFNLVVDIYNNSRFIENFGRFDKISLYLEQIFLEPYSFIIGNTFENQLKFNNSSLVTLSDNSFLEYINSSGIVLSILFSYIFIYYLCKNILIDLSVVLIFLFISFGFFITTSIYFLNYILIIYLLLSFKRKELV